MLNLNKCIIVDVNLLPVHSSVIALEEGTVLAGVLENGILVATPSTGVSGEKFVGVAQSRHTVPTQANGVLNTTIPATGPYTISLAKTPISAGNVIVYINGTIATQGSVATGVYAISGNVLTFAAADAGKTVNIVFRYNLTQAEANLIFGGDIVASSVTAGVQLSCISTGTVYVDNYVITDNWATATAVYMGANGKFTTTNTGTLIDAIIAETPVASGGFLGLMMKP